MAPIYQRGVTEEGLVEEYTKNVDVDIWGKSFIFDLFSSISLESSL